MRRGLAHLTLLLWLIVGAERGSRTEHIEGIWLRWAELLPELWVWLEIRAGFLPHHCALRGTSALHLLGLYLRGR